MKSEVVGMDDYCLKQFENDDQNVLSTKVRISPTEFLNKINEIIKQQGPESELVDGYAPFCKHLFVSNFVNVIPCHVELTDETKKFIKCGYEARRVEELAVLCRWISKADALAHLDMKPAKYIDLILYSREQIAKEELAMTGKSTEKSNAPNYSIISLKFSDVNFETPMQPITMMRNTIIEEGGSGVPIDRNKYKEAVDFWSKSLEII